MSASAPSAAPTIIKLPTCKFCFVTSHNEAQVSGPSSLHADDCPRALRQRPLLTDDGPLASLSMSATAPSAAPTAIHDTVDDAPTIIKLPTCKFCFVTSHNEAQVSGPSSLHADDCPRALRQRPLLTDDGPLASLSMSTTAPSAAPTAPYPRGEWMLIFRQTGGTYQKLDKWRSVNPEEPDRPNFSILDRMETFRDAQGAFKFKMRWEGCNSDKPQVWSQTSNPLTSENLVEGYTPIDVPYHADDQGPNQFRGLATGHSSALLNGSQHDDRWWWAVGSVHDFATHSASSIPGPDMQSAKKTELFVYMPPGGALADANFHDNGGDHGIHDTVDDASIIILPTCKFCFATSHNEAQVSGPSSIHADDCPRALRQIGSSGMSSPSLPKPKPELSPSIRYLPDSFYGAREAMHELTDVARAEKEPGARSDLLIQHIGEDRIPTLLSGPASRGIVDHLGYGVCAAASIASALNACYEGVEGPDKPEKRFTWEYILFDIIEKHGGSVRTKSGQPTSAKVGNNAILKVCRAFPNIKAGLLLGNSGACDLPSSWSKFRNAIEKKRSVVLFHCTNHYCLVQGCMGGHEYKHGESYIFTAGRGQEATVVRSWDAACRIITEKISGNYRMLRIWYDGP